jgi:hypothetical protein
MRGSPGAGRDFRAGVIMSVEADREKLSAFQALIRQSLEYFEATDDDVLTSVQGRRQKIRLGQSKCFSGRQRFRRLCAVLPHTRTLSPPYISRSALQVLLPFADQVDGTSQGTWCY